MMQTSDSCEYCKKSPNRTVAYLVGEHLELKETVLLELTAKAIDQLPEARDLRGWMISIHRDTRRSPLFVIAEQGKNKPPAATAAEALAHIWGLSKRKPKSIRPEPTFVQKKKSIEEVEEIIKRTLDPRHSGDFAADEFRHQQPRKIRRRRAA